jgi:hypothetical protein
MWICAYTINHGDNRLTDFWTVHETEAEAIAAYRATFGMDNLHCAAVAKISEATEPHWVEWPEREPASDL